MFQQTNTKVLVVTTTVTHMLEEAEKEEALVAVEIAEVTLQSPNNFLKEN